ncbi:myb-related mRNAion factor [Huso huso]|uniref:Myb-related mRNAion factor n=1 Tax=Huso huso TaxID=61971 RepID=A0ABR0ZJD2_HUSHU
MVGKIKRVRQKLHHEAVKLTQETREKSGNSARESVKLPEPGGLLILKPPVVNTYTLKHVDTEEKIKKLNGEAPVKRWNVRSSSIFAETKISPEALVQSLDLDATQSPVPIQKGDQDATGASSASPAPERRRKPKFRASENDVLVTEVLRNRRHLFGNASKPCPARKAIWQEITAKINRLGVWPRDRLEVQKRWFDIRANVRKKANTLHDSLAPDGSPPSDPLTLRDQRILATFNLRVFKGFHIAYYTVHGVNSVTKQDSDNDDDEPQEPGRITAVTVEEGQLPQPMEEEIQDLVGGISVPKEEEGLSPPPSSSASCTPPALECPIGPPTRLFDAPPVPPPVAPCPTTASSVPQHQPPSLRMPGTPRGQSIEDVHSNVGRLMQLQQETNAIMGRVETHLADMASSLRLMVQAFLQVSACTSMGPQVPSSEMCSPPPEFHPASCSSTSCSPGISLSPKASPSLPLGLPTFAPSSDSSLLHGVQSTDWNKKIP